MLSILILGFPTLATLKAMGLHKDRNTKKWETTGSIYKSVQSVQVGKSMLSTMTTAHACIISG